MQISTQYSSVPAGNCVSAQTSTNQTTGPVRLAFFWLTSASGCASSCVFYYLLHRSSVTVTHGQRCGYKVLFQYNGVVLRVRMPHCQLSISNPDGRQTTNKCWARDLPSHNSVSIEAAPWLSPASAARPYTGAHSFSGPWPSARNPPHMSPQAAAGT